MVYSVEQISIEEKDKLVERYAPQIRYEIKSDIYGCCIKLLTGLRSFRDRWEDNFYFISQNIRSHGRLYVVDDSNEGDNQVRYDPLSRTAFLLNFNYYGWIKSLALSIAGDVLEDEHEIYSVHGACLDVLGRGVCIVGGSGAGKTTHTYGLLRKSEVRVVSDDWFFSRIYGEDILAYGSEKNFYIRAELANIWKEFAWLVDRAEMDEEGRGVVDLRWIIGKGRIMPLTTLETFIILKRDPEDSDFVRKLDESEALKILEENSYFNPHLLVRCDHKQKVRSRFFRALLQRCEIFQVNTIQTPEQSQEVIRKLAFTL